MHPVTADEFAGLMAPLGPWGARVAVAVSGGADSLCLALLAAAWGNPIALIVDHGLRTESADEAALTAARLAARGIQARVLTLHGLVAGPGLAARARAARYAALTQAAQDAGCLDLLLGHHLGDQAETRLMRARAGSGPAGLACMAPITHTTFLRLVRPLLTIPPERLRATLRAAGQAWVEDPSNRNLATQRARLRAELAQAGAAAQADLAGQATLAGAARASAERAVASTLAAHASLYPEGFALLTPGPLPPPALAALLQTIGGNPYKAATASLAHLAANPRPSVLAGVRLLPAGKLGAGLLLVREQAAMQPPVAAVPGAIWDRRFHLSAAAQPPDGATLGPVGDDAARLRAYTRLPAAVVRTLAAVRAHGLLVAVPQIGYPSNWTCARMAVEFAPSLPACGAPFGL